MGFAGDQATAIDGERTAQIPPQQSVGSAQSAAASVPGLVELFVTFLVIGVSAFGMAIMQAIRTTPVRRGWLRKEEIDEGFGLVQLYPGAIMVDLVAYIGYRMRRVRGALVAVAGFVLPSLLLLLGLSWAYFTYGAHPEVRDLVIGLDALVVGVLVHVSADFGSEHARGKVTALVALGAFVLGVTGQNVLWAVLGGFLVGGLLSRTRFRVVPETSVPITESVRQPISWRRLGWAALPGVVVIAGATAAAFATGALAAVSADMAKIGAVAFGNGTAIMPILRQDALAHHWLNLSQFGAGVGFGQVTPGPFLSTAAFVGYGAARWWGGVAAGVAIYAPSVAMTMVVAEIYPWLRRLGFVRDAIGGVMAAFTGLLASMVVLFGRPIVPVPAALGLAAGAFVAIRVLKWNTIVVFATGLAVWGLYLAAGGAV
ncbi:MAG: chromate transporter [Acidimicrobiales bacterium]